MVQIYCASPFLFFFGITCTNNLCTIKLCINSTGHRSTLVTYCTVWLSSHLLSSTSIYFKLPNCPRRTLARPWPSSRLSFPLSPALRLATFPPLPSQCPPVSCSTLPRSPESPPSSSFSYHLLSCPFSVMGRSKKYTNDVGIILQDASSEHLNTCTRYQTVIQKNSVHNQDGQSALQ